MGRFSGQSLSLGTVKRQHSNGIVLKSLSKRRSTEPKNRDEKKAFAKVDDIINQALQLFRMDFADGDSTKNAFFKRLFWVINPNHRFRRIFDAITVIWVLILVFFIPFEVGFVWFDTPAQLKIIFAFLDLWFALDIILNFRTGYLRHGNLEMDSKKIVKNYLSTWFLIDVLGTFPFEEILSGNLSSRKSLKLVKYFKIPKLLRVSRVLKYFRSHKNVYDFSKVLILIFISLHVCACVWVKILNPCEQARENFAGMDTCSQDNVFRVYCEALHISSSMLLGVSNFHVLGKHDLMLLSFRGRQKDHTTMFLVSSLCMIIGLFIIALLISEANVYVMGKKQGSAAFQLNFDRIVHEMEYYAVPNELQSQVRRFYDYVWTNQKQYDDKIALLSDKQMSTHLQRKLALHLFKDVFSQISFFSELEDLVLGEICLALRTRIYLPSDIIIYQGDVGKEFFIIAKGVVEVLQENDRGGEKPKNSNRILLHSGQFFGEIALVTNLSRTRSVQAVTMCEINVLDYDALDPLLDDIDDFSTKLTKLIVKRQLNSGMEGAKEVDVKVSKYDMERAENAVEQSMRDAVYKRRKNESSSISDSVKSSELNGNIFSYKVSTDKGISESRGSIFSENPKLRRRSNPDVLEVINDIKRRSALFPGEKSGRKSVDRATSASISVRSDADIVATEQTRKGFRRYSMPVIATQSKIHPVREVLKVDDEKAGKQVVAVAKEAQCGVTLAGNIEPGKTHIGLDQLRPKIRHRLESSLDNDSAKQCDSEIHLAEKIERFEILLKRVMSKLEGRIASEPFPAPDENGSAELSRPM